MADGTPKKELTNEEAIEIAVTDVRNAMLKNIKYSKLIVDVQKKKDAARYELQKANQRLNGLYMEYVSY